MPTLEISPEVAEKIKALAEQTQSSVDEILLQLLDNYSAVAGETGITSPEKEHNLGNLQQKIKTHPPQIKRHQFATPAERIQALQDGIAEFREGLSDEDWEQILWAVNHEYVDPKDLTMWDWLDDIPEDERS